MKKFLLVSNLLVAMLGLNACTTSAPMQQQIATDALGKTSLPEKWQAVHDAREVDQKTLGFTLSPALNALVEEAITYNADVKMAASRMDQSRAALKAVAGSLYPQLGIGAQTGTSTLPTSTAAISGAGLIASWDLDIWGRVRSEQVALTSRMYSAELDARYLKQSIAAQVVKSWLVLTEQTQQIALAQKMVELATRQRDLLKIGVVVGRNSQQDLALNESLLATYQQQVVVNQQAFGNAQRALEVMLGRYPASQLQASSNFPQWIGDLPAGIPSQLLSRRPDVVAAEERFKAAFQEVEVAKRAKLPGLKITGGIGYIENSAIQLSNAISNPISSLTAQLLMPLFLGGQLDAQVEAKTALQSQSLAQYQKTALNALSEVEGGLANERWLSTREVSARQQLEFMERSKHFARLQQEVGKGDQFQYLQQELNVSSIQSNLLRLESERLVNRVALHQALGGQFTLLP